MTELNADLAKKLFNRLDQLEQKLTAMPDKAWTLKDCARFMQCSDTTAFRMSKVAGFPKPVKPQTNDSGSRMVDRYDPEEFRAWFYSRANRAS